MSAYIKIIYSPLFSCIWIPSLNERINQSRKNWTPAQSESRPVAILRNFWLWRNCYNSKNLEQGLPFWGLVHAHKAQIKHEKGNAGIHKKKILQSVMETCWLFFNFLMFEHITCHLTRFGKTSSWNACFVPLNVSRVSLLMILASNSLKLCQAIFIDLC